MFELIELHFGARVWERKSETVGEADPVSITTGGSPAQLVYSNARAQFDGLDDSAIRPLLGTSSACARAVPVCA